MLDRMDWGTFRKSGMLWFVNRLLHIFGWAIVFRTDDSDKVLEVYPARCKYKGFEDAQEQEGFKSLTEYMHKNASQLLKDFD